MRKISGLFLCTMLLFSLLTVTFNITLVWASSPDEIAMGVAFAKSGFHPEGMASKWARTGVIYLHPSSPEYPIVMAPDQPPHSWWTYNFELFERQKQVDLRMIKESLGTSSTKSVAIYFPQFLGDTKAFGTLYLGRLEEVVSFFHENGLHVFLFLGRPDVDHRGVFSLDPVKNRADREYVLGNIRSILLYGRVFEYITEVSLYWMGYANAYTPEEVLGYNRVLKSLVNSVGAQFFVHIDGPWWETDLRYNGYTTNSVSPKNGASDGLFAESWAQGKLPAGLQAIIPEYFKPSQIIMICDVPNGDINPKTPNAIGNVQNDMEYWFKTINEVGVTSWFIWDYYDAELRVPSTYATIYPNATKLTQKGEIAKEKASLTTLTEQIYFRAFFFQNNSIPTARVIVDGIAYSLPFEVEWLRGTTHTIQIATTKLTEDGTQHAFSRCRGSVSSTNITTTISIIRPVKSYIDFKTQYRIKVISTYGEAYGGGWYDANATATITITSLIDLGNGTRRVFMGWKGDMTDDTSTLSFKVDSPKTLIANWKTQFYLKVNSEFGEPQGEGWYDEGSTATFSVTSPVEVFVFDHWTGDSNATTPSATVVIYDKKTVTAVWRRENTPPTLSITSPTIGSTLRSSSVIINWSGSDAESGIDHFEVKLDEETWINVGANLTCTFIRVSEGSHIAYVKAVDRAGNSKEEQISFIVNTSLVGGPGWIDEMAIFGVVGAIILISLFIIKRGKVSK